MPASPDSTVSPATKSLKFFEDFWVVFEILHSGYRGV
jgi:hypothetical protein